MKYLSFTFTALFLGGVLWIFYFLISAANISHNAANTSFCARSYNTRSMRMGYKAMAAGIRNDTIEEKIFLLEEKKYRQQSDSLMSIADSLVEQSEKKFQMAFFRFN